MKHQFDRDALSGIYRALSQAEREEITRRFKGLGGVLNGRGEIMDSHLWLAQLIMEELGHIVPIETSPLEAGAAEYEEAMLAQDLMARR